MLHTCLDPEQSIRPGYVHGRAYCERCGRSRLHALSNRRLTCLCCYQVRS